MHTWFSTPTLSVDKGFWSFTYRTVGDKLIEFRIKYNAVEFEVTAWHWDEGDEYRIRTAAEVKYLMQEAQEHRQDWDEKHTMAQALIGEKQFDILMRDVHARWDALKFIVSPAYTM